MASHTRGHRRGELWEADDEGDEGAEGDDQEPEDNTAGLKHQAGSSINFAVSSLPPISLIPFSYFEWSKG